MCKELSGNHNCFYFREWAKKIPRLNIFKYNPHTESIEPIVEIAEK